MRLSFFAIAILLLAGQAQADISLAAGGRIELGTDRPLDLAATRISEPAANIELGVGGSVLIVGSAAPLVIEPARPISIPITNLGGAISIGSSTGISLAQPNSGLPNLVTAAVPEPKNYAMLLAGLALMGFIVRRRNAR